MDFNLMDRDIVCDAIAIVVLDNSLGAEYISARNTCAVTVSSEEDITLLASS